MRCCELLLLEIGDLKDSTWGVLFYHFILPHTLSLWIFPSFVRHPCPWLLLILLQNSRRFNSTVLFIYVCVQPKNNSQDNSLMLMMCLYSLFNLSFLCFPSLISKTGFTKEMIPKLKLGNVECGGGWGVGEQFAKLPSHDEQRAGDASRIFTVASAPPAMHDDRHTSSDDDDSDEITTVTAITKDDRSSLPKAPAPHVTSYAPEREDDDDTFVDHGSAVDAAPAKGPTSVVQPVRPPVVPTIDTSKRSEPARQPSSESIEDEIASQRWTEGQLVSRVRCLDPINAVVVSSKTLWAAIGNDPLTLFELCGCDLQQQRSVASVTGVRSMTQVTVPAAKSAPQSFKQPPVAGVPPRQGPSQPLSRTNSCTTSLGPQGTGASEVLWCGLDRGRIAIVDLFFFSDDGVIAQAHSPNVSVTGLWSSGPGRVWSSAEDMTLKLWDAATRKIIRVHRTADVVTDVCHVPETNTVWTCSDLRIVLYSAADGQELRLRGNPFFRTKSRVQCLRYQHHAAFSAVWVATETEILLFNAKTYDVLSLIPNLSCRSLDLTPCDTAVLVGHTTAGSTATAGDPHSVDRVIVLDCADPRRPSLHQIGDPLPGIATRIGVRCFPRVPLGVAANRDDEGWALTVFTTQSTEPLGNWGCMNGARIAPPPQQPPQLSTSVVPVPAATSAAAAASVSPKPTAKLHSTSSSSPVALRATMTPRGLAALTDGDIVATGDGGEHGAACEVHACAQQPVDSAALTQLHDEIRDVAQAVRGIRLQQPVTEDFYTVYRACINVVSGPQNRDVTSLTSTLESVIEKAVTSEGRLILSAIADLAKRAAVPQQPAQQPIQQPPLSTRAASQDEIAARPPVTNRPVALESGKESDTIALLREQYQHVVSGLKECERQRNQLQSTIVALQRQNQRLQERNAVLVQGVGQLQATAHAHAMDLIAASQEKDISALEKLVTSISPAPLALAAIPEISAAVDQLRDAVSRIFVAAKSYGRSSDCSGGDRSPPRPTSSRYHNEQPSRFESSTLSSARTPHRTPAVVISPTSSRLGAPAMPSSGSQPVRVTARRLYAALRTELMPVEQFTKSYHTTLACLVGSFCRLSTASPSVSVALETSQPDAAVMLDASPTVHDIVCMELLIQLCRHETTCTMVEELMSSASEGGDDSGEDCEMERGLPRTGRSKGDPELDSLIGYMTTVSLDLETAAGNIRKTLMERYATIAVGGGKAICEILPRIRWSSCRLRGLLTWDHLWLRCLAVALDEIQGVFFCSSAIKGTSARGGGSTLLAALTQAQSLRVPRHSVEFMLEKVLEWKSTLTELRRESEMLFHALSEAQRVVGNGWGGSPGSRTSLNVTIGGQGSLTKSALLTACLQVSTVRALDSGAIPPVLVDEPASQRSSFSPHASATVAVASAAACDDVYGLLSEGVENIGAVLHTKIDALLPVCARLATVIQGILSNHPIDESQPDDVNNMLTVVPNQGKPPLEEGHKQFCMTV